MDLINGGQVWGLVLYVLGSIILSFCSKLEHEEDARLRDPRNRMGKRPGEVMRPKTLRGTLMTVTGCTFSVVGAVLFFMNIDMS